MTTGDPKLESSFRPITRSPLNNRVNQVIVPVDSSNVLVMSGGSIGALQAAADGNRPSTPQNLRVN